METIKVYRMTEDECQEKLDRANESAKSYEKNESRLTDFGRYCLECDRRAIERYSGFLYLMRAEKKDCIYFAGREDTPIPHEIGEMLYAL